MLSRHVSVVCSLFRCCSWDASAPPRRGTDAASPLACEPRCRDATVITVFQAIQQQTGCSFVYNTSDIDTDRKVSLSAHDEPLQAVLDKLFAGSDIAYTLRDKHIVLSKKAKNSPPTAAQAALPES